MATARAGEQPLRRRLLAWLLGPLMVLLLFDTVAGWWSSAALADLAYDRTLHEVAREVALHVRATPQGPQLALTPAAESALLVNQDDQMVFRVWDEAGVPLGGDARLPRPRTLPPPDGAPLFYDASIDGESLRVTASWQRYDEKQPAARVLVQVAETMNKRRYLARDIVATLVAAQLVLVVMAVGLVWLGIAHGLQPLDLLRREVADRSHVDLSPIDPLHAPQEVRPLVEEVNSLMARLGEAMEAQSRFVADAAHQLKTPVAGLKAQIDVALGESDPARIRHSLAQLYLSAERLSRLVQQLLALARNEPGAAVALRLQPVDLAALALDVAMEWAPQALRRSIDLGYEGAPQPVIIEADADRIRELLVNLIDNAVRYTRDGGNVTVAVDVGPQGPRLSISDDGPTIPPQERERVFQRFHRLLGVSADGSGLGLAIVSEIASLHGALITLEEDRDGTGNTFIVHFPQGGARSAGAQASAAA